MPDSSRATRAPRSARSTDRRARASASSSLRDNGIFDFGFAIFDLKTSIANLKSKIENFVNPLSRPCWLLSSERVAWGAASTLNQSRPKEEQFGSHRHDERTTGGRRALRPPGQALEPEDEGVHLRRAQRHQHH